MQVCRNCECVRACEMRVYFTEWVTPCVPSRNWPACQHRSRTCSACYKGIHTNLVWKSGTNKCVEMPWFFGCQSQCCSNTLCAYGCISRENSFVAPRVQVHSCRMTGVAGPKEAGDVWDRGKNLTVSPAHVSVSGQPPGWAAAT